MHQHEWTSTKYTTENQTESSRSRNWFLCNSSVQKWVFFLTCSCKKWRLYTNYTYIYSLYWYVYLNRILCIQIWKSQRLSLFTGHSQRLKIQLDYPTSFFVITKPIVFVLSLKGPAYIFSFRSQLWFYYPGNIFKAATF